MANKRCCSSFIEKGGGCPVHSKIKMVVQLKPEHKTETHSPTFYSWVYQNKIPDTAIILGNGTNKGMLKRIEPYYTNKYNCIEFYKEGIEQPIHVHKP